MKLKLVKVKCKGCGYIWLPRQDEIFECPNCKRPLEKVGISYIEGEEND